ncbi:MAG TPA: hypothetical protein P5244_03155 [Syntrophales bacterium]|mgnify:CR=1 FL=1|nr:hypothetical protein [Syntrophales bacterium]HOM08298.1 hypothetical protein [Syntrophales bacterium]HOO00927.1 hypothetical protein [Syntrophales bacterium]HRR40213.1 hypothetical protein [Syntrophales bacterium]HRT70834.1 hypothetical protein [Syntrophales bacterium]
MRDEMQYEAGKMDEFFREFHDFFEEKYVEYLGGEIPEDEEVSMYLEMIGDDLLFKISQFYCNLARAGALATSKTLKVICLAMCLAIWYMDNELINDLSNSACEYVERILEKEGQENVYFKWGGE